MADRATSPRILPFCTIGDPERRLCAAFGQAGGGLIAFQATCRLGTFPAVSIFATRRDGTSSTWEPSRTLLIDQPLPAPLSRSAAPVLQGDADAATLLWPLEDGGLLMLALRSGAEAAIVSPPEPGLETVAFCADGARLHVAATRSDGTSSIFRRDGDGAWQAPETDLDLPPEAAITGLSVFAGHLHAAVANRRAGFSLWRAPVTGGPWQEIVTRGAWRYGYNPAVTAMAVAQGRLLVAVGGVDIRHVNLGDEHPELLAVAADGSWELFSGQPRFSPDGLLRTTTTGGPGTPAYSDMTVAALATRGDDVLALLVPSDGIDEPARLCRWSAVAEEWSRTMLPAPATSGLVSSIAWAGDGTILLASGADTPPENRDDAGTGTVGAGPQSLLAVLSEAGA